MLLNHKYCFYKQQVGHNLRVWKTQSSTKPFTKNTAVNGPSTLTYLFTRQALCNLPAMCRSLYEASLRYTRNTKPSQHSRNPEVHKQSGESVHEESVCEPAPAGEAGREVKGDAEFYWGFNRGLELSLGQGEKEWEQSRWRELDKQGRRVGPGMRSPQGTGNSRTLQKRKGKLGQIPSGLEIHVSGYTLDEMGILAG